MNSHFSVALQQSQQSLGIRTVTWLGNKQPEQQRRWIFIGARLLLGAIDWMFFNHMSDLGLYLKVGCTNAVLHKKIWMKLCVVCLPCLFWASKCKIYNLQAGCYWLMPNCCTMLQVHSVHPLELQPIILQRSCPANHSTRQQILPIQKGARPQYAILIPSKTRQPFQGSVTVSVWDYEAVLLVQLSQEEQDRVGVLS